MLTSDEEQEGRQRFSEMMSRCQSIISDSQAETVWEIWDFDSDLNALEMLSNVLSDYVDLAQAVGLRVEVDAWLSEMRVGGEPSGQDEGSTPCPPTK